MIVGIALFNDEISPRFDCCTGLAVVDTAKGFKNATRIDLRGTDYHRRVDEFLAHKLDVLLCGGIRRCDFYLLKTSGIDMIPGLSGSAADRLADFTRGSLKPQTDPYPSGRGRRREMRSGRKKHGGHGRMD